MTHQSTSDLFQTGPNRRVGTRPSVRGPVDENAYHARHGAIGRSPWIPWTILAVLSWIGLGAMAWVLIEILL